MDVEMKDWPKLPTPREIQQKLDYYSYLMDKHGTDCEYCAVRTEREEILQGAHDKLVERAKKLEEAKRRYQKLAGKVTAEKWSLTAERDRLLEIIKDNQKKLCKCAYFEKGYHICAVCSILSREGE